MTMTPDQLEDLAEALYRRAGLPPAEAVPPLFLAGTLLGWEALVSVRDTPFVAKLEDGRLLVRAGETRPRRAWHVARALAQWALEPREASSATLDSLAAYLRTPRAAFVELAREVGPDFTALADAFGLSESAAALRYGETMQVRLILESPSSPLRVRGTRCEVATPRVVSIAGGRTVRLYAA